MSQGKQIVLSSADVKGKGSSLIKIEHLKVIASDVCIALHLTRETNFRNPEKQHPRRVLARRVNYRVDQMGRSKRAAIVPATRGDLIDRFAIRGVPLCKLSGSKGSRSFHLNFAKWT